MDWDEAKEYLYEMKKDYEEIGVVGRFALTLTINPIVNRFENGERTQELYDDIMSIS